MWYHSGMDNLLGRRTANGYVDFGANRVPQLPQWIGLTDRVSGIVWYLSHSEDLGYVELTDERPASLDHSDDAVIYPAFEEPFVPGLPNVRLIVEGGLLGMSVEPAPSYIVSRANARLMTRRAFKRTIIEIAAPPGWREPQTLQYEAVSTQ